MKNSYKKNYLQLLLAVLFIFLFAQIRVNLPFYTGGIPITGQTFAVLLTGYALGRKWGTLSVSLYVLLGVLGVPVFADGGSGWKVLAGNSGGFLAGFIAAAYVTSWLGELGWSKSFGKSLAAMTIGTGIILAFGLLRLAQLHNFSKALQWGFFPFLPGAIIKIIAGAAVIPLYIQMKKK